jgi:hypothetical protein
MHQSIYQSEVEEKEKDEADVRSKEKKRLFSGKRVQVI